LKYLSPLDLVAPSLACSAWRPTATGLIYNRVSLKRDGERSGIFICGLHLRNIVFGSSCNIKRLDIRLRNIKGEYIPLIIRLVAPTLSSLYINFHGSLNHYETLDIFLSQCARIRNLLLYIFNFGRDSPTISPSVEDGFARLIQLDLIRCRGDVSMFVDRTPIPNLQSLKYWSNRAPGQIVTSLAMKYRSLTRVILRAIFDSSSSLLKIVECCRDLKKLTFGNIGNSLLLIRSDFDAIASLPLLNHIVICGFSVKPSGVLPLSRCKELTTLKLGMNFAILHPILSVIGESMKSLSIHQMSVEAVEGVLAYSPNLECLAFIDPNPDKEIQDSLEKSLKSGLKSLSVLQVDKENKVRVRLGTDWMGYA
jgi:hypothetical protein